MLLPPFTPSAAYVFHLYVMDSPLSAWFAPGTGSCVYVASDRYAAESFPGITQALRDGDETLARAQVLVASSCINDAAVFLSGGGGVGAQDAVETAAPEAAGP